MSDEALERAEREAEAASDKRDKAKEAVKQAELELENIRARLDATRRELREARLAYGDQAAGHALNGENLIRTDEPDAAVGQIHSLSLACEGLERAVARQERTIEDRKDELGKTQVANTQAIFRRNDLRLPGVRSRFLAAYVDVGLALGELVCCARLSNSEHAYLYETLESLQGGGFDQLGELGARYSVDWNAVDLFNCPEIRPCKKRR